MLRKTIAIITLSSAMFGFDLPNQSIPSMGQNLTAQNSSKITSKAQAELEEKRLIQLASYNPKLYWMLGVFYMSEYKYKDGTFKKAQLEKARKAFELSSNAGILLSDYFLAIIAYKEKNIPDALNILDNALNKIQNPIGNKNYNLISAFYLSIILDYYPKNEALLKKGINSILPAASDNKVGSSQYLLANAYLMLGMKDKANFWLNQSCLNPQTPQRIKQICNNFKEGK